MDKGVNLLFDDRKERPGVKFRDADLIGIPYQIVIGEKNLAERLIEVKDRKSGQTQRIPVEQANDHLFELFSRCAASP